VIALKQKANYLVLGIVKSAGESLTLILKKFAEQHIGLEP
jgi:hypothetical protein